MSGRGAQWAVAVVGSRSRCAPSGLLVCGALLTAVSAFVGVPTLSNIVRYLGGGAGLADVLWLIGATAVLLFGVALRLRQDVRTRTVVAWIVVQAVLTAMPHFWVEHQWWGVDILLGWFILIVVRPPVAWPAFLCVDLWSVLNDSSTGVADFAQRFLVLLFTGGLVQALLRIGDLVVELHEAKARISQLAVAEERAKMSRDLHDSLGQSLVAIMLRAELAEKLAEQGDTAVAREIRDLHGLAEQALADVRVVAHGRKRTDFDRELAGAVDLLGAVGSACELRVTACPDPPAAEVLGWALREGVTNILCHSEPMRCVITAKREDDVFRLSLANDGLRARSSDRGLGSGLAGLTERVRDVGGTLTSVREDGWFTLTVSVPVSDREPLRVAS